MVTGSAAPDEDKVMGRSSRLPPSPSSRTLEYEVGPIKSLLKIVSACGPSAVSAPVWSDRAEAGGFNTGGEGTTFWTEVEEDVL
jgi:hypothetical protein